MSIGRKRVRSGRLRRGTISVARFVIRKMDVNPATELSMVLLDTNAMADHMRGWTCRVRERDELPDGRARARGPPGCSRAGAVDARRHRAVPAVRRQAGRSGRSQPGHGAGPADRAQVLHLLGYDHAEPERRRCSAALYDCSRSGLPTRSRPTTRDRQAERTAGCSTSQGISTIEPAGPPLIGAIALTLLAGLFSAIDAISAVSAARVGNWCATSDPGRHPAGTDHGGTPPLRQSRCAAADYLRVRCGHAALVAYLHDVMPFKWALVAAAAVMTIGSFVVVGVGPWAVSTPTRSPWRPRFRSKVFRFCSPRSAGC